jgi:membrane associated rhomboid family serine protease
MPMDPLAPVNTIAIIVLTVGCSLIGFRDPGFTERFIFSPLEVLAGKQYYRLVTSAFLHADLNHLLMNMISLFLFGRILEEQLGPWQFLLIYFASVVGGSLLSLWLHRNHDYRAYGASGGVCGVVFSYVALNPTGTILLHFFIPMPSWVYGILFLAGSFIALRRQRDNVGHDAHIGGAVIGMWTTGALEPLAVRENLKWFLILSAVAVALFFYFLKNPMMLPISAFRGKLGRRREEKRQAAPRRRETRDVDEVLDKISREGMESLTAEERELLQTVSQKFQSRAQSEKPKSDLII